MASSIFTRRREGRQDQGEDFASDGAVLIIQVTAAPGSRDPSVQRGVTWHLPSIYSPQICAEWRSVATHLALRVARDSYGLPHVGFPVPESQEAVAIMIGPLHRATLGGGMMTTQRLQALLRTGVMSVGRMFIHQGIPVFFQSISVLVLLESESEVSFGNPNRKVEFSHLELASSQWQQQQHLREPHFMVRCNPQGAILTTSACLCTGLAPLPSGTFARPPAQHRT